MSDWLRKHARKMACFVFGHRWHVLHMNPQRASALLHLHVMAGMDADCERCGKVWRDA